MNIAVNNWVDLKFILLSKNLNLDFYENATSYDVWAVDGQVIYTYRIWKKSSEPANSNLTRLAAERDDFERNYKNRTPPAIFAATVVGLNIVTPALDIFEIDGSLSKIIEVLYIRFSGTVTTAVGVDVQIIKRATLNIGGSVSTVAATPYISLLPAKLKLDLFVPSPTSLPTSYANANEQPPLLTSQQNTATATVKAYTDNGILGVSLGVLTAIKYALLTATTLQTPLLLDYSNNPLVLSGPQESICVNLNGATTVGPSVNVSIIWRER